MRPDLDGPDKISKAFDILVCLLPDYRKLYNKPHGGFAARLPNYVREVITDGGAVDTIDPNNKLVVMTHEIITELKNPGTFQEAVLLIACLTGDIVTVQAIAQKYAAEEKILPLHRMIVVVLDNSQAVTTQFCLDKSAVVDHAENRYAAWLGRSADLFKIVFRYNIFQLDNEPRYIHRLLIDAVRLQHVFLEDGLPVDKIRTPDIEELAEFLTTQGAEVTQEAIKIAITKNSIGLLKLSLSRVRSPFGESILRGIYDTTTIYNYEKFSLVLKQIPRRTISPFTAGLYVYRALHRAADAHLDFDIITYLLDHRISVNEKSDYLVDKEDLGHHPVVQHYALNYAVSSRNPEVIPLLFERGADSFLRNAVGQTAFEVLAYGRIFVAWNPISEEQRKADQGFVEVHEQLVQVHNVLMERCGLRDGDPKRAELREQFNQRVEIMKKCKGARIQNIDDSLKG